MALDQPLVIRISAALAADDGLDAAADMRHRLDQKPLALVPLEPARREDVAFLAPSIKALFGRQRRIQVGRLYAIVMLQALRYPLRLGPETRRAGERPSVHLDQALAQRAHFLRVARGARLRIVFVVLSQLMQEPDSLVGMLNEVAGKAQGENDVRRRDPPRQILSEAEVDNPCDIRGTSGIQRKPYDLDVVPMRTRGLREPRRQHFCATVKKGNLGVEDGNAHWIFAGSATADYSGLHPHIPYRRGHGN